MRLKLLVSVFLLSGLSGAAEIYQWRILALRGGGFLDIDLPVPRLDFKGPKR